MVSMYESSWEACYGDFGGRLILKKYFQKFVLILNESLMIR